MCSVIFRRLCRSCYPRVESSRIVMINVSCTGPDCFSDTITCPHCLEIDEERTDYPRLEHDGDHTTTGCPECGKLFKVTLCVEYTWQSKKLPLTPSDTGPAPSGESKPHG